MHARRALLPLLLLAAYAFVHCTPRSSSLRSAVENDMPQAQHTLAIADAPRSIEELQRRIGRILEREHIPGVAIALVGRDGPLWVGGVGVRDRAAAAPMDADTVFRVGSLTKSIVALGVMRLVDQGKLDIDRPLREILPDVGIDNPWEAVAPVTLAQCLEHTAGLDDVRFNEIFTTDERLSVADTLRLNPRSRKIRWRPGTRHGYSNVGYTIAARAIEVASGEPFDQYLRREIMTPLGILDADFHRTSVLAARLATGYMEDHTPAAFRIFAHRPSGGLLISATELAKLVQFWIRRGDGYPAIVSPQGLARIEHSGTVPYPHIDTDYGFANYGDVQHPVLSRGHDGGMPGFHSSIRYFPTLDVGYVMLLNSNYSFRGYFQIRALLFSYLTQGRTFSPPPTTAGAERPGADYFELAAPRSEVFSFIDQALMGWQVFDSVDRVRLAALQGWTMDVVPTQDGGYRLRNECGSSVRFTTNRDGTPVMILSFLYAEAVPRLPAQIRFFALAIAMMLLRLAPLWAVAVLGLGAIQRRRVLPLSLVVWPALAGLCCFALPLILQRAFLDAVIGIVHPLTVALCGVTIAFAVASTASLLAVIRWSRRPDRPRLSARLFPTVCAIAFFGLTMWLAAHGFIGLRTWAW